MLVPLIEGQDKGWPAWTFVTLAAGVLLIVAFALWEVARSQDANPMVPPHLFSPPGVHGRHDPRARLLRRVHQHLLHHLAAVAGGARAHRAASPAWSGCRSRSGASSGRRRATGCRSGSAARCSSSARRWSRSGWSGCGSSCGSTAAADLTNWDLLVPLLDRRHRQRAVHRAERAVHRRDGRPVRGGRRQRRDQRDAARRQRHRHRGHRQRPVRHPAHHEQGPGAIAQAFVDSAAHAMAVSAVLSVVSFALVFVLPRKVDQFRG